MSYDDEERLTERILYGLGFLFAGLILALPIGATWDAIHGRYITGIVIGSIILGLGLAWIAGGIIQRIIDRRKAPDT
jgi:hypothetical protein